MPREVIHHSSPRSQHQVGPRLQMEVGWQRDCDMQVSIATEDQSPLVKVMLGDNAAVAAEGFVSLLQAAGFKIVPMDGAPGGSDLNPDSLGAMLADAIGQAPPFSHRVSVYPTRVEANNLIRATRKGRDGAYGRDE